MSSRIAPELRLHWIGWPGSRDWLAGSIASEPMDRSERVTGRSSMAGRVPAVRQRRCHWGEVRLRSQSGAAGVCSGQQGPGRGPSVRWRLAMPGATAWLGGIGPVCPERRAGLDWIGGGADGAFGRTERSVIDSGLWAWLTGLALAIDQNRHSGRSRAQTRNPCPVAGDGIAAPLSRGQALRE
ncbi:hypothetical protein L6172_00430 [Thalassospiraceae bacterium SW-3-3]|nr:hypothetical protein L6172_00430 [Thalassospiraceae bacterium SW-3-3]